MSEWFSSIAKQAIQAVDNITESLVEQANLAQQEINKEQEKVKQEVAATKVDSSHAVLPWETDDEELGILSQDVMEKVLSLSLAEPNFTETPPQLDSVPFDFSMNVPTVMRLLTIDSNLARMHSKVSKYELCFV